MGLRVLAIGAHPDDIEVGAGGYLQRATARLIVIASAGEKGGDPVTRTKEARAAGKFLEADVVMLNHCDTQLQAAELAPHIEEAIRVHRPDVILTTSPRDRHQDHEALAAATIIAARNWPSTILGYYSPSVAERFRPNWFAGLTEADMAAKLRLAACHASQAERPYMAAVYLEATGRYWAQVTRSQAPFVEPYELLRHTEVCHG